MTEPIATFAASRIEGSPTVVGCRRMSSGFANANYRLETNAGTFLLRDCKSRSLASVEHELEVLKWLHAGEFPVAAPIPFAGGERWITSPGGSHLILLEFLDGSEPSPNPTTVAAIGDALGKLHQLPKPDGNWWRRENTEDWDDFAPGLIQSTDPDSPEPNQFFVEHFRRLESQLSESIPTGFTHGDVFTDNTLFRDNQLVAILDFECAREDSLLHDIAMTIHGFCYPDETWRPDLAKILLEAYEKHRSLTEEERALMPVYLQWSPLILMGWHLAELQRRPDPGNHKRAAEHQRRMQRMAQENWKP